MLSIAIQHHPSRAHLIGALRARLGEAEIVRDPDPDGPRSALRTYREALRRTPTAARHRLIVQDDAWPCADFRERAAAAIRERPEQILAFFVPGVGTHRIAMQRAAKLGESWALLPRDGTFAPTVALCWPVAHARDFLEWAEEHFPGTPEGDDGPVGVYVRARRHEVWATVPSLVEHPNEEPSLFGKPSKGAANRGRVAAVSLSS